jgi:hypothetical protein
MNGQLNGFLIFESRRVVWFGRLITKKGRISDDEIAEASGAGASSLSRRSSSRRRSSSSSS